LKNQAVKSRLVHSNHFLRSAKGAYSIGRYRELIKSYKLLCLLPNSSRPLSLRFLEKLLAFVVTLQRLEFPANVRVHTSDSLERGKFCVFFALLRLGFYNNNAHELSTAYPNFSKNCWKYTTAFHWSQHKKFSVTNSPPYKIFKSFAIFYRFLLTVLSLLEKFFCEYFLEIFKKKFFVEIRESEFENEIFYK